MPTPSADTIVLGGVNSMVGNVEAVPSHTAIQEINEKRHNAIDQSEKEVSKDGDEIKVAPLDDSDSHHNSDKADSEDQIIITGEDAAKYLLPLRDDYEPCLTFRSMFLSTVLSGFQATMYQIYSVSYQ